MKKIVVTGLSGFISHHFGEHILKNTDWEIIGLDRLSYASLGYARLRDNNLLGHPRVTVHTHDISTQISEGLAQEIGEVDYIVHMAAETHVDNSIKNARPFVKANVIGTMEMLEFARTQKNLKKFLYFSTDEVFGPAPLGTSYKEWDRYNSTNPYAATKAGGEELCLAYANTYGLPLVITHSMNVYGERQHKEKFIPIIMRKVLSGDCLEIHCKDGVPARRSWIHARNSSSAVLHLLENGEQREKYNITGEAEYCNLDLAKLVAQIIGKELNYKLVDYYADRPGHDPRYMLDGTKIHNSGWIMPIDFEDSLKRTVNWTMTHRRWLEGN